MTERDQPEVPVQLPKNAPERKVSRGVAKQISKDLKTARKDGTPSQIRQAEATAKLKRNEPAQQELQEDRQRLQQLKSILEQEKKGETVVSKLTKHEINIELLWFNVKYSKDPISAKDLVTEYLDSVEETDPFNYTALMTPLPTRGGKTETRLMQIRNKVFGSRKAP